MTRYIILLLLTLLFTACSFEKEPNEWQFKSASYFKDYQYDFLSSNDILAKGELNQAIQYAKKSSNLNTLARVYLGKCALNISVGIEDRCEEYQTLSSTLDSHELHAYYSFITKNLQEEQIQFLEKHYQDFVKDKESIFDMPRVSSTLLCAALEKENLDDVSRKKLTELASFYGYKKVVLFWLNERKKYLKDTAEIQKINIKITILNQN